MLRSIILSIFGLCWFLCNRQNFLATFKREGSKLEVRIIAIFILLILCFRRIEPLNFLIAVEIMNLPMIFAILNYSKDLDKYSAVLFMFFFNLIGSIPFMISRWPIIFAFKVIDENWSSYLRSFVLAMAIFLILCCKLPVYILHFWLTKAHVRSFGVGSMLLASLILKIGTTGMFKFNFFLPSFIIIKISTISWTLVSGTICAFFIFHFLDLKQMVAYSSVVHMAFILPMSLLAGVVERVSRMIVMVRHGVTSLVLFFLVTLTYEAHWNRRLIINKSSQVIGGNFYFWLIIYLLINLGFPPFARFLREVLFIHTILKRAARWSTFFFFSLVISRLYLFASLIMIIFSKNDTIVGIEWKKNMTTSMILTFSSLIFLVWSMIFCSPSLNKTLLCGSKNI